MSLNSLSESDPVRVLHAVNRMDRGGLETLLMRLYRALDPDQIQFDFIAHRPGKGAFDNEISARGGRIFRVDFSYSPARFPSYRREVLSFFERHPEFQVVHSHLNAFNGTFLSLARRADVATRIAHSHAQSSGNSLREPLWNLLKRLGRSSFTERLGCSREAGYWAYGRKAEFSVIQNAFPIDAFSFDVEGRRRIRNRYGLENAMVVGHVGSFRPDKNQRFLLAVLAELRRAEPTARLLFVGEGEGRAEVEKQVAEMGLQESVVFVGEVSESEAYYSAMDVLAFPSVSEGLGIVAIEAQASGLPCVLSTGVPPEAAATDLAVRLPLDRNRNVEGWAGAIKDSLSRSVDRERLRPELNAFDIAETARRLQEMYIAAAFGRDRP